MISRIIEGQSFQSASAGSTATMRISNDGSRLRSILLKLSENSYSFEDHVSEIRLRVGGTVVRTYTPAQFKKIVNFNGAGSAGGTGVGGGYDYWRIALAEPWRRSATEQDALAWGTATPNNGVIQLEVDLTSNYEGGLKALLEVDDVRGPNGEVIPLGEIMQVGRIQLPFSGAGKFTWNTIPRRGKLHRLHFFSHLINKVEIIADGMKLFEMDKGEVDALYKQEGLNPANDVFTVAFDFHQRLNEFINLRGVGDFRVDLTLVSGATPFPVVYEFREQPN